MASDEQLELHNLDYSLDISQFANSTHDLAATFRKVSLCREAGKVLRKTFETGIGREASGAHSIKSAATDVFSLAEKLVSDGLAKEQSGRTDCGLSKDIHQAGAHVLRAKVEAFNAVNRGYSKGVSHVVAVNAEDGVGSADRGPIDQAIIDPEEDGAYARLAAEQEAFRESFDVE